MYICICNAYKHTEITEAARAGNRSVDDAYCWLGEGPRCRRCVETAQTIIDGEHAALPIAAD